MTPSIRTTLLCALGALLALPSWAQSPPPLTAPWQDTWVSTRPAAVPDMPDAGPEAPAAVIFSNFGRPPDGFAPEGWTIMGRGSDLGLYQAFATQFTPRSAATVGDILIGVGIISGLNAVKVSLNADDGGSPGTALAEVRLNDLEDYLWCCKPRRTGIQGIALTAGRPYWVVVRPLTLVSTTKAAWAWSGRYKLGRTAMNHGSYWAPETNYQGSLKVLAQ